MAGVHTVRAMCMAIFPTFIRVLLSSLFSLSSTQSSCFSAISSRLFVLAESFYLMKLFCKSIQLSSSSSNIAISCLGQEHFVIDLIQHNHDAKPSSTECYYSRPEISYADLRYTQNLMLLWRYRFEKSYTPASLNLT
jgi:hypothetical protein